MTWHALAAALAVALPAGAAWWLRRSFVAVTITGTSMVPTFDPGDRVLVRRMPLSRVRSGDVVVYGDPARLAAAAAQGHHALIIKRVAAVPGEQVPRDRVPALAGVAGPTVPPGRLVLLGDNAESVDSKQSGYYDGAQLVGRVVRRLSRP